MRLDEVALYKNDSFRFYNGSCKKKRIEVPDINDNDSPWDRAVKTMKVGSEDIWRRTLAIELELGVNHLY